jgi:hypothetical protein
MILGINGKAMAGKDTFGKMLAESLHAQTGNVYTLMAFAKSLKEKVQKDFDLSWDQLWGEQKEVVDKRYMKPREVEWNDNGTIKEERLEPYWTSREILQEYGTFFRSIDSDFWVKELFKTIDDKEYENVIITDVRFPNEMEIVSERGGLNIAVLRDAAGSKINAEHISETALDNYSADIKIVNNSSLEDLRATADDTVKVIKAIYNKKTEEL